MVAFIFLYLSPVSAQNLYSKAYGNRHHPAVIFIHGGPRGNATLFEGTTAQKLAETGFYVIAYDRRGEGRSIDSLAKFTFEEAFTDLKLLMEKYRLSKVNLIGHSFGGIVATLFSNRYPEKVDHLILVAALFSQQESYNHILSQVEKTANVQHDTISIRDVKHAHTMDTLTAAYRGLVYDLGSRFGYFKMPAPTAESNKINKAYLESEFYQKNIRNDSGPILFYKNESLVNIDTKSILKNLIKYGIKLSAIYGQNDGIFSAKQLNDMKLIVGENQLHLISNCAHYPFVDQQKQFLRIIQSSFNQ